MKKLFFGAIAAMTLAACSQEDIETTSSKSEKSVNGIEYNVSTRNQSRVSESYSSTNLPGSFKVWAIKSDNSAYINGETITKDTEGTYAGTKEYEWPGDALNFFATVNGDATVTDGTAAIKDFTVATAAAEQVDLLYASTPNQTSGTVGINFKHALSQVCFKAKNSNSNISVVVKSVGIGYLNNKGTYTLPSTSEGTGAWSDLSGTAEYTVAMASDVTLTSEAQPLTSGTDAGILAVIPQKQSKLTIADDTESIDGMTKNGAYFILNAVVTPTEGSSVNKYEGNIYVPVSVNFEEGTRYIYTLTFSTGDGGYRDNTSTVIGGGDTPTCITYNVSCADYVDSKSDNEMTSVVTKTETITPTIAAHVRASAADNNYTSASNVQMIVKGGDSPFYGIMSFTIPSYDGYKVKSASLRLISRQLRTDNGISIYSMGEFTADNATYTNLSNAITTALEGTAVSFTMAGEASKQYVGNYTTLSDDYKALSAWENDIDITSLVDGTSLYLLLARTTASSTDELQFYPLNVVSSDLTTINTNTSGSYTKADLIPQLTVTYVATE